MNPWRDIAQLSKSEIFDLQNRKLNHFLNVYVYPFSQHYREFFDRHRIDPRKVRTIQDLKCIPFSSKLDFVDSQDQKERFKGFVLQPDKEKIRRYWPMARQARLMLAGVFRGKDYLEDQLEQEFRPVFMTFTTGTTNQPVPFVYSNYDIKNLHASGARMLSLFGIKHTEKIVNMFPYAPHLAFWQVVYGGIASCALILSTGGGKVMGTEGNIAAVLKMQPSVILGVPSFVYHMLRAASEKGCDMSFVKKVVLGASRLTIPFKMKINELLKSMGATDVSVFGTYGFTESRCAWAECPTSLDVSSGYHLYPDKEIFEIIDPETGEVKKEGEDGELVYTSIDSRASVVLRYRTGDFVKGGITCRSCPHCRLNVPRISSDIIRLSDVKDLKLSKIKGSLVNINNFISCMSEIPNVIEWQIEIRKKDNDPYEVDELVVYLGVAPTADRKKIEEGVCDKMLLSTEVKPNAVYFIPLEELVKRLELETANKEKRIVDSRPKL